MDLVGSVVSGPRAQRAFALRVALRPGWRLRIEDEAALCLLIAVGSALQLRWADGSTARIEPGQIALVRGPDPYDATDVIDAADVTDVIDGADGTDVPAGTRPPDPASPEPLAVIGPDGRCRTPNGEPLHNRLSLGIRSWGDDPSGETSFVTASYASGNEVGERLLAALPRVLMVPTDDLDWPVAELLKAELGSERAAQDAVIDRLLDLLLLGVLRSWQERAEPGAGVGVGGQDELIRRALAALQHNPAEPWTVASLARFCGVSRAVLARRFTDAVRESPMAYLAGWRIQLAADLLLDGATLERAARAVGYASPFALSAAFKRVKGVSPQQFRSRAG